MNGVLGNLAYVCSEIWKQISVAQRLSIVLVGLLGLSALGAVLYFGTRPNWHVLYSDVPQATAAQIYELAEELNIPVKLTDGGTTVKVPYKHASTVRAQIARSDIDVTQESVGLELFDDLKLGMTEMQQRVGLQRALQGELERMIMRVEGVEHARVMLALPEPRIFSQGDVPRAEASVFVETTRHRRLRRNQVHSICRMVASAVPELRPEDVAVTDSNGELLATGVAEGPGGGGFSRFMELQQQMEQYLKEKAEAALRPIVGPGAVVAVVNVELDTRQIEKTTETYDADSAVIVSEKVISEDNTTTDRTSGGPAGTASNMVSVENPEGNGSPQDESSESRKTMENQYMVPKTIEHIKGGHPQIKHLGVAVTIAAREAGGPRSADVLEQYRALVMSSVGGVENSPEGRNDKITVVEEAFAAPPPITPAASAPGGLDRVLQYAGHISAAAIGRFALALMILLVLYRKFTAILRRSQLSSVDLRAPVPTEPASQALTEEAVDAHRMLGKVETEPASKVRSRAEQDPAEVAATLERWLKRDSTT